MGRTLWWNGSKKKVQLKFKKSSIMQHGTTKCYLLIFIIDILNNTDQKSN